MKKLACLLATASALLAGPAYADKSCEELKAEIEAKLDAKGVKNATVIIIGKNDPARGSIVVGSCERGEKAVAYKLG